MMKPLHHDRLDSLLYGFINSADFAAACGAKARQVMSWRDGTRSIPQEMLPQVAAALHQLVDDALPQPHCIARLSKIMEGRAA